MKKLLQSAYGQLILDNDQTNECRKWKLQRRCSQLSSVKNVRR